MSSAMLSKKVAPAPPEAKEKAARSKVIPATSSAPPDDVAPLPPAPRESAVAKSSVSLSRAGPSKKKSAATVDKGLLDDDDEVVLKQRRSSAKESRGVSASVASAVAKPMATRVASMSREPDSSNAAQLKVRKISAKQMWDSDDDQAGLQRVASVASTAEEPNFVRAFDQRVSQSGYYQNQPGTYLQPPPPPQQPQPYAVSSSAVAAPAGRSPVHRFHVHYDQELGSGGFGVVYKAFDSQDGVVVAAKETIVGRESQDKLRTAMQAEFDLLSKMDHPNIVRVLSFNVSEGKSRIFMEWMPMGSVLSILRGLQFRFHERVVRRYAYEALQGLRYLHARGVVHRDIKPGNMLVSGSGVVKLSDFGTCKETIMATSATATQTVGTPCYMAPESISQGRYTAASDVWSIACSILEMADGRMPWSHLPTAQRMPIPLMFFIGTAAPPNHHPAIPPHLSAELKDILERCFAQDPQQRPSADALLQLPYFAAHAAGAELPASAETRDAYDSLLASAAERVANDSELTDYQRAVSVISVNEASLGLLGSGLSMQTVLNEEPSAISNASASSRISKK